MPIAPSTRLCAALLALAAGAVSAACGGDDGTSAAAAPVPPAPPAATQAATAPAPATTAASPSPAPAPGRLSVHVRRPTPLRASPGGRVIARLAPRTEFDSPTVLAVVAQRGPWYGVLAKEVPNGRVGWISVRAAIEPHRATHRVDASLSRREVVIRRDGRVVERFKVAIGAPSAPTPTGRFAVTDKLLTHDAASPYGCCILALSGRQPRTPQGWGGGDRLAIHATNLPNSIGTAASLGCLRAPTDVMQRIVRSVPLGTIVRIRA